MYPHHRGSTAAMIFVACTVVVADACYAQEADQQFDIAAGPATSTINRFAKQAGMNVLASEDILTGISTNRLQGSFPASQALRRLLAGTGLYGKVTASGAVFILAAEKPHAPAAANVDEAMKRVLVVGTRASQQSSIDRKKTAATAMD